MYLTCSNNNRASTVLSSFTKAFHENGLPTHVRSDLGGENVDVWRYMVEQHYSSSAVITGSSTQNEKEKRLWCDAYRHIGVMFQNTFSVLDVQFNEVEVFCLHVESCNNHSLSTREENNLTIICSSWSNSL